MSEARTSICSRWLTYRRGLTCNLGDLETDLMGAFFGTSNSSPLENLSWHGETTRNSAEISSLSVEMRQLLDSKWNEVEEDTIQLLQRLIRIDTQNMQEEGTEIEAVRHLEDKFIEAGIEYEVMEPKPGRGNIVARVRGDGTAGKGALLLGAHLDTVKAPKENWEAEGWKHSPYGGVIDEEDGCLYGRGAIDMKHMVAMSVTLLCFVKKQGIILSRDLIFAGVADEERRDSQWGAKYLVKNRPELIEADVILSEVGGFSVKVLGVEGVTVQIAEKGSMQVKITANGPGGHSAMFNNNNPIATIGEVAHKLHTTRLPLRINMVNTATIESFSACLPFPKSFIFRCLLNPIFSNMVAQWLPPIVQRSILPVLHNTANPTSVEVGTNKHNQIPTSAWLMVDMRFLPQCTSVDAIDDIKSVLGYARFVAERKREEDGEIEENLSPELTIEVISSRESCYQDTDDPLFKEVMAIIQKVTYDRTNGAPVITVLTPGSTDFIRYMQHPTKKPVCIGFTPVWFEPGMKFTDMFHGTNERVPLSGLKWGVKVLADVVYTLCDAQV